MRLHGSQTVHDCGIQFEVGIFLGFSVSVETFMPALPNGSRYRFEFRNGQSVDVSLENARMF